MRASFLLPALLFLTTPLLAAANIPVLNWVERSDWVNVKTDVTPAAVGDGAADDTTAIQKALDGVTNGSTVYLPAGTYRITHTLTLKGPLIGVLIVGNGRDTRLVWDGEAGGRLFVVDGAAYTRYVGMVLDGKGKASVGFCHFSMHRFETEVRHQDMAFLNFTDTGLLVDPKRKVATAETLVENCLFENCGRGAAILMFNEYDFTFDGCEFRKCGTGIQCAHGNFYARDCHFEESSNVDFLSGPEHASSIRRCTSVGSKAFLHYASSVATMTIEDCHVEGWTNPDGAITLGGAPIVLFDCSFTKPPNDKPPVKILRGGQRLIVSQNTSNPLGSANLVGSSIETGEVIQPGNTAKVYTVPAGKRSADLTSAHESFLQDKETIPTVVYDAKTDFGAKGDGVTDDTAAIQKTIDTARAHGKGAIAYLPTGFYAITDTLHVTGADYYIGGSGFRTGLVWRGPEGGTMIAVTDPQHVTFENLAVGNHDSGKMNNAIDILQTSSGKPSFVTYDNVSVFGMYQRQPFRKGLWLRGLSKGSVVLIRHLQGNLHLVDAARATILANTSYEGSVVVEGKDKRRDGFLGFLTRLDTSCPYGLYVKDNHSIVMSDFYIEQAENGLSLEGAPGDPPGRVTIQGAKLQFNKPKQEGEENIAFNIDNYEGQFFFGHDQFYVQPKVYRLIQKGDRPLEVFIWGACFYNSGLEVQKNANTHVYLIGNDKAGSGDFKAEDVMQPDSLKKLSVALDDLRALGALDLKLNHPEVARKAMTRQERRQIYRTRRFSDDRWPLCCVGEWRWNGRSEHAR